MGTMIAPLVENKSEEESEIAKKDQGEFPDEYEGDGEGEEEEQENLRYWKGNVRVDTIVYPPVTGDLLVHEKKSGLHWVHIDLHLPQGQVLLNDTMNMIVSFLTLFK